MKRVLIGLLCAAFLLTAGTVSAAPIQWTGAGSTGNWYEGVLVETGITWDEAQAQAATLYDNAGGYLVTFSSGSGGNISIAELDWVFAAIADYAVRPELWGRFGNLDEDWAGPWVGASRLSGMTWSWENGEGTFQEDGSLFTFDSDSTPYAHYFWDGLSPTPPASGILNDTNGLDGGVMYGYIVEWDENPRPVQDNPIPEPATLAMFLGFGGIGLAVRRFRRRK